MTGLDRSRLLPPDGYRRIAARLESRGFQAWAVGGCLRDAYVGQLAESDRAVRGLELTRSSGPGDSDWDVATDAKPSEVMRCFRRTVPVGISHGTVGVLDGQEMYEVTTFRRDVETDGRHAQVEFAASIDEDLARRDFTANAMAWRSATGDLRDPHRGAADIESGVLRAVGDPAERFREDYLRVLRGLRFAGRYKWKVEPGTGAAMRDAVDGLPTLAAERVREELFKVLASTEPSFGLDMYAAGGALAHWYPDLESLAARRDDWRGALDAVDVAPAHRPLVRLASLLVRAADTPGSRAAAAESLAARLRFSNKAGRYLARLARLFLPFPGASRSAADDRRWLASAGDAWQDIFRLHIAGARAGGSRQESRELASIWRRVHAGRLANPPLSLGDLAISGTDILDLGVPRGPGVRRLLDELLEQVLDDPGRNSRPDLLDEAQRLNSAGAAGMPARNDA